MHTAYAETDNYLPSLIEDTQTTTLLNEIGEYIEVNVGRVCPFSLEEYFLMLLSQGLKSRIEGNYGIAAAVVVREQGHEIIVFGRNSILSENNPHGHAEMNAISNARQIINDPTGTLLKQLVEEGGIIIRPAPDLDNDRFLITTLEPCPMCTVGSVINSDVRKVIIGTEDNYAGALLNNRLSNLAPLWQQIANEQNLDLILVQSNNPEDTDTFIPANLNDFLFRLFFDTKSRLDQKLSQEGFINLQSLGLLAQGVIYGTVDGQI